MAKTTIYLVRHGESAVNAGTALPEFGSKEGSPLTDKGRQQAKELAEKLKSVPFSAAYASHLIRAKETARIIAEEFDLEVIVSPHIHEKNYTKGVDTKNMVEIAAKFNKIYDENNGIPLEEKLKIKLDPDMESGEDVIKRMLSFFQETQKKHPDQTILVVSHGNAIRTFLHYIKFALPHELPSSTVKNTGYIKFDFDGEEFTILETYKVNKIT